MIYKVIRLKLFSLKIQILLNIKFKRKREREGQVNFILIYRLCQYIDIIIYYILCQCQEIDF